MGVVFGDRELLFEAPHIKTVCRSYWLWEIGGECSIFGVTAKIPLEEFELGGVGGMFGALLELLLFGVCARGILELLWLVTGEGPPEEHDTASITGGDVFGVL